jgi:hypothetical protein
VTWISSSNGDATSTLIMSNYVGIHESEMKKFPPHFELVGRLLELSTNNDENMDMGGLLCQLLLVCAINMME